MIHIQATRAYYTGQPLCDCPGCRNFYTQVKAAYPMLSAFPAAYGIDVEKPDEIVWMEDENGGIDYLAVHYTASGSLSDTDPHTFAIEDAAPLTVTSESGYVPNRWTMWCSR